MKYFIDKLLWQNRYLYYSARTKARFANCFMLKRLLLRPQKRNSTWVLDRPHETNLPHFTVPYAWLRSELLNNTIGYRDRRYPLSR